MAEEHKHGRDDRRESDQLGDLMCDTESVDQDGENPKVHEVAGERDHDVAGRSSTVAAGSQRP